MSSEQRPSSVRFLIVAVATLMSFLLYVDRFCVSFAEVYIKQDLGLSYTQLAWFTSGFFWTYALAQVPAGWLSDRYGARIMLTLYIVTWSVFTAVIGAANGFALLIIARFGCGIGQAGAYPTAASVIARWMPTTARGLASSFVGNGGRVGAAVVPIMTAFLIVQFVPLGTPVEITSAEIVGPHAIVTKLAQRLDASETRSLFESVGVERVTELKASSDRTEALTDKATQDSERLKTGESVRELLRDWTRTDGLIAIAQTDKQLKFERESIATLKKLRDKESVSEVELDRLKRMTLEALFPNEVMKLYRLGWRQVVIVYGLSGIVVAAFFWFIFRERPDLHPKVNAAERELIQRGKPTDSGERKLDGIPTKALLTSINLWANSFMQFGTNVGWLFIFTGLSRYLLVERQVPIIERSFMAMLPVVIGVIGGFMGGKLTDVWATRFGVLWGRRLPILASRVLAIGGYVGCIGVSFLPTDHPLNSAWTVTLLCGVAAFATDFGAPATWAFAQDIGGRHVASVLGWGNMWGNIGAAVGPLIYNFVLGETPKTTQWNWLFATCALAFAISGCCAFIMDATKPLLRDGE